jgi:hypothetical protein
MLRYYCTDALHISYCVLIVSYCADTHWHATCIMQRLQSTQSWVSSQGIVPCIAVLYCFCHILGSTLPGQVTGQIGLHPLHTADAFLIPCCYASHCGRVHPCVSVVCLATVCIQHVQASSWLFLLHPQPEQGRPSVLSYSAVDLTGPAAECRELLHDHDAA